MNRLKKIFKKGKQEIIIQGSYFGDARMDFNMELNALRIGLDLQKEGFKEICKKANS